MTSRLNFRLDALATDSRARAATFRTLHNEVQTPLFMPVGTQATVKAQLTRTRSKKPAPRFCSRTLIICCSDRARKFSGAPAASTVS